MNRIEIHIIAYNEQIMLPFTIAHYKRMFKNPHIIIHDNFSTDRTIEIAVSEGCTVIQFTTDGMNDTMQSHIKSHAAMGAKADWVLCIDADEECMINDKDLDDLDTRSINLVQFEGWNIFDQVSSPWDIKVPMGIQDGGYSKPVLIRTGIFSSINFGAGAHVGIFETEPGKTESRSVSQYKLLHYKHWSCEYNINRSAELGSRQSEENKRKRHSFHFGFTRNVHEDFFNMHYANRKPIIDNHIIE